MIEQKIIFGCDHIINTLKRMSVLIDVVKTSLDTERLIQTGNISEVFYVYQIQDSLPVSNYRNGIDYVVNGNSITWISSHRPAIGSNYSCEVMMINRTVLDYSKDVANCERCFGQGWYVDMLTSDLRLIAKSQGLEKLVQDYIKILYTITRDDGYGTNLLTLSGNNVMNEEIYLSEISSEINSAALQLREIQGAMILDGKYVLDPKETLSEVEIISTEYFRDEGRAYVKMRLISEAGSSAVTNFSL